MEDTVEAMVDEGLTVLDEFEKTGNRSGFKTWLGKYGDEVEERGGVLTAAVVLGKDK